MEKREFRTQGMKTDNNRTVTGYALKWNKLSVYVGNKDVSLFREQFTKGAFTESLRNNDVKGLYNHDKSLVLGRNKSGTLRLSEDDVGLYFELDLPDTTLGRDTYESVERGDLTGVSVSFNAQNDQWNKKDPNNPIRTVTKAKLNEISIVPDPAYPDSIVEPKMSKEQLRQKLIKQMDDWDKKEVERLRRKILSDLDKTYS